jgi:hypothetical protein
MIEPQWFIASASVASALLALALALGLKEWIFRPRVQLLLRHRSKPDEISDRVVTKRLETGETAAFVRLRVDNRGRSTAQRVGVRVLQIHTWDHSGARWIRARPELDGRLLQPSNQVASEPDTVDVFPNSDRIVDIASVGSRPEDGGPNPLFIEIGHPWPPNRANVLEPGAWRLELLVCGDNISAQRYFVTVCFDGCWPEPEGPGIWDHFRVDGPSLHAMSEPTWLPTPPSARVPASGALEERAGLRARSGGTDGRAAERGSLR